MYSLAGGFKLALRCGHFTARSLHLSGQLLKDYYKTLGVARNASQKDIKKAYYQLAKKYHPDTNKDEPSAARMFQEVSEAYEVLSDDNKRAEYDMSGGRTSSAGAGNPYTRQRPGTTGTQWNYQSNVDPEELFRKIFGEFSRGFNRQQRGGASPFDDLFNFEFHGGMQAQCTITFLEAVKGTTKEVDIMQMAGSMWNPTTSKRKVRVPVPAGIADGQTLRLSLGSQEVFITVRVEESPYFRREGYDVHTEANISISQAILGGIIRIQGLYEELNVRIPPGTDSHTELTLSGRGLKHLEAYNTYGDHIVHLHIKLPTKLTPEQKEIIQEYAYLESNTPGTVNGVDKSSWTGYRRRSPPSDKEKPAESGGDEPGEKKEEENPGILARIKKAIFG
uniref:Chaperone protein dnaJ n=1 Tax=Acartia pacifica TaxID=335913 RepID=A0A0U2USC4_ACAPC|nr:chaperone protein dnaJ [Acartia pacifica]